MPGSPTLCSSTNRRWSGCKRRVLKRAKGLAAAHSCLSPKERQCEKSAGFRPARVGKWAREEAARVFWADVWWNRVLRCVSVGAREGVLPQSAFDFMFLNCTRRKTLFKAEATVLKDPLAEILLAVSVCLACPAGEAQTPDPLQPFDTVLECSSDPDLWEPRACPSLLLPYIELCRVCVPAEVFLTFFFPTDPAHDVRPCSCLCVASLLAFLSPLHRLRADCVTKGVLGAVHSCRWLESTLRRSYSSAVAWLVSTGTCLVMWLPLPCLLSARLGWRVAIEPACSCTLQGTTSSGA